MAIRTYTKGPDRAIAAIPDDVWVDIDYIPGGVAQVAECTYKGRRLIVRRTRLTDRRQAALWPDWRHFAFLTDLDGDAVASTPSTATTPWWNWPSRPEGGLGARARIVGKLQRQQRLAVLRRVGAQAHPLDGHHGPEPFDRLTVARTVRMRLIAVPARLVNRAGALVLRGPLEWPWAAWSSNAWPSFAL